MTKSILDFMVRYPLMFAEIMLTAISYSSLLSYTAEPNFQSNINSVLKIQPYWLLSGGFSARVVAKYEFGS